MKQYEYKTISTGTQGVPQGKGKNFYECLQDGLNQLGRQGWQLCVSNGHNLLLVFMREKKPRARTSYAKKLSSARSRQAGFQSHRDNDRGTNRRGKDGNTPGAGVGVVQPPRGVGWDGHPWSWGGHGKTKGGRAGRRKAKK